MTSGHNNMIISSKTKSLKFDSYVKRPGKVRWVTAPVSSSEAF